MRGNTVLAQPSDSGMVRVDEETNLGVAVSTDCNGRFAKLDPYAGAQLALAESYRNVATGGAIPLAISDCLNFGSPEDPDVMWQFAEACRGLKDACLELGIPVTGGNVSLYNQTGETAILPTPVVAVLGVIEDVTRRTPSAWSPAGERVFLLGETREELSGSEWAHVVHGHLGGLPPRVDLAAERALAELLREAVGLLTSAHDLSDGGLAPGAGRGRAAPRRRASRVALPGDAFLDLFAESAGPGRWSRSPPGDDDALTDARRAPRRTRSPRSARPAATRSWSTGQFAAAAGRAPRGLDRHPARRAGLTRVRRRTALALPALGLVGAALDACREDAPVSATPAARAGSATATTPASSASSTCRTGTPRGVVVVIHGGFWRAEYDLSLGTPAGRRAWPRQGWAAWNLEYRRVGAGAGRRRRRARHPRRRGGRHRPAARPRPRTSPRWSPSGTPRAATSRPGPPRAAASSGGAAACDVTDVVSQAGVLDLRAAHDAGLGGGAVEAFLGHPPGRGGRAGRPAAAAARSTCRCGACTAATTTIVPLEPVRGVRRARRPRPARPRRAGRRRRRPLRVIDTGSAAWEQTLAILDAIA